MGIKVDMDMRQIRDYLNREAEKHIRKTITLLKYVGETVVNDIRTSHISNWIDRTGNLRSSIGYIITLDGKPIEQSSFERVFGPEEPRMLGQKNESADNGSEEGKTYARQLASLYPQGIALIVVAGMEYASYVERRDNKTVLAQGEIEAKTLIAQMINQLNSERE